MTLDPRTRLESLVMKSPSCKRPWQALSTASHKDCFHPGNRHSSYKRSYMEHCIVVDSSTNPYSSAVILHRA